MQLMLGLLLFAAIIIMVTLIFIGYFMYANSKRTAGINQMLSSKEADLVELYDTLAQMMEEMEQFTQRSKLELQSEMNLLKEMQENLKIIGKEEPVPKKAEVQKPSSLSDEIQMEKERLMQQYQKCFDLKGAKVRAFYNKGLSIADIAKEMGIGQGEVMLILNLKKKII